MEAFVRCDVKTEESSEMYGKIPSAMERQRHLAFADHCYRCEDQPVKHLVVWEGQTGMLLTGQVGGITCVKQLLYDSFCETGNKLQRKMNNQNEWAWYHIQVLNGCKVFTDGRVDWWPLLILHVTDTFTAKHLSSHCYNGDAPFVWIPIRIKSKENIFIKTKSHPNLKP